VVDPWGKLIAKAEFDETVVYADIGRWSPQRVSDPYNCSCVWVSYFQV
jgi:predicted amidohydrolase